MSGTVGPAAKREIIARLAALPALDGVQVEYSPPGSIERECIYLGKVGGPVALSTMKTASGRVGREEDLNLQLTIWVRTPGERDQEAAEDRAVEIGQAVEELIAGNPTLSGAVAGLTLAAITSFDLDAGVDDDGAVAELTYTIGLKSFIR